jgi:predicted short-subunit dehydrogenase-like oxidoreductase (DUF2520 family)
MTDYSTADRISAVWDRVRPKFAGAFHADSYRLLRTTRVSDGRGGTTPTEAEAEAGRCELVIAGGGLERLVAGTIVQSSTTAAAALPLTTGARADDVLEVNGRRYNIAAVTHPGEHGLFPIAQLEAVS